MRKRKFYILTIIALIVLIICGSVYIGVNLYLDSFLNDIEKGEVISKENADINFSNKIKENDGTHEVVNFLLVGADNNGDGKTSYQEARSDATKIISLDYTTKKIKITNLERDVVVYITGDYNKYGHLNWAYEIGGPTCTIKTINYNLDTDITKYITISFGGFVDIINAIGGIDVEISADEAKEIDGLYEGINHLDGNDALAYARERYDSDFVRVERQNTVIKKVIEKVKELSYSEILNLIGKIVPYISTNLSNEEIKKYLFDILSFDLNNITTHTWPSGEYDDIYRCPELGGYLLTSYEDQLIELHQYIWEDYDYTPSKVAFDNIQNIYNTYSNND